jgi:hypothetical protein
MVQLDGYFFICTFNGTIYQSAINDPSSWAATDVLNADYSGDEVRFLFKVGNYIGAAGRGGTVQYFWNAGNPSGTVLSGAPNLTLSGITLNGAPLPFDGVLYCIASTQSGFLGPFGLYRISGPNGFTRVSDDVWSSIICDLQLSFVGSASIGANKNVILLHSSDDATSVVYDPSTNMFSFLEVSSAITSTSSLANIFTRASSSNVISWASGNTWTDESSAYTLTIQTEPQDMNNGMDATDVWVDLLADNESTGSTTLSTTDDDYANWVDRGSFDMTKTKKRLNALGLHNVRAYRLQHSANTGWRGQLLRVNYERAVS